MASSAPSRQAPSTSVAPPDAALTERLCRQFQLDRGERAALDRVLARNIRTIGDRVPLVTQGEPPGDIAVVLSGWAARYREMEGGRRLLALNLPGDVCDFDAFTTRAADSTIEAIGPLCIASISRAALNDLTSRTPRVGQALWWTSLANAALQRASTWNVATRSAEQRIAHLVCELLTRLWLAGIGDGLAAECPLSQADLAAACGMTTEHTNRTLKQLRDRAVMCFERRGIRVLAPDRLAGIARFDPSYLHAAPDTVWPLAAPLTPGVAADRALLFA